MNSEGSQPSIHMYPFSPKLPSHPGCCKTLRRDAIFVLFKLWWNTHNTEFTVLIIFKRTLKYIQVCHKAPELFLSCKNWNSVPIKCQFPVPLPPAPMILSMNLVIQVIRGVCLFVTDLFHLAHCPQVHPWCGVCLELFPLQGWWSCIETTFCLFVHWWTLGGLPPLSYCNIIS